jgi:hypothetical protein
MKSLSWEAAEPQGGGSGQNAEGARWVMRGNGGMVRKTSSDEHYKKSNRRLIAVTEVMKLNSGRTVMRTGGERRD